MKKVSVIMPVYNSEKYLPVALDSVLAQTLKDIEIICVDDGSTDSSVEILREYQKKDDRLTVLCQKNSFAGVARNYGMSVATGEYLSFLDSDDYFEPEMLGKAYKKAKQTEAEIVVFGGKCFTDVVENAFYFSSFMNKNYLEEGREIPDSGRFLFTNPAPWNKLFLHKFVKENNLQYRACKRANDLFFVMLALAKAKKIETLDEELICYRRGNSSSLQGTNNETPELFAEELLALQQELKKANLYEKYKDSFVDLALGNCMYNLGTLSKGDSFERLYRLLKEKYFSELGLPENLKDTQKNHANYEKYQFILTHSPVEYWMDQSKKSTGVVEKEYLFPFAKLERNKAIILYGAGKVGRKFYSQLEKSAYCESVEWVDKKIRQFEGKKIVAPPDAGWSRANYIIIAVEKQEVAEEIEKELTELYAITSSKVIWEDPVICR